MMVQNMMTKQEMGKLQKVFKELDKNNDGVLQYDELLEGYEKYYGDCA